MCIRDRVYQRLRRSEPVEEPARAQVVPSRDDIAVVYRYLRSKGNLSAPDEVIYAKLRGNISCLCKLKLAIDVLDEMHLVTRGPGGRHVAVVPNPQKVDISQSKILRELQSRSLPAGV